MLDPELRKEVINYCWKVNLVVISVNPERDTLWEAECRKTWNSDAELWFCLNNRVSIYASLLAACEEYLPCLLKRPHTVLAEDTNSVALPPTLRKRAPN